jgi:hypothetical protein
LSRNGREREDGSVDPNTGRRPQSRGFFGRGRSSSRAREFSDKDESRDQGDRGRSMSRTGSSRRRLQVEDEQKDTEYDHNTSYQVRKDEQSWDYDNDRQDGSREENLDRTSFSHENMNQNEVKEEVKPEQQQEEEEDPDALTEEDVMNLDPRNTKVHAACLLHYPAEQIVEQLRENNRLAFKKNSAGEMPLHYAAMDKKGVEFAVLDALIKINRDAVMQPNVQNSLPVHLACMVGAPSSLAIKTFLTLYPDSVMIQNDFPLPFEADMMIEGQSKEEEDEDDIREEAPTIPSHPPQQSGGLMSMFACAAPPEAAIEIAEATKPKPKKKKKKLPKVESGFTPLHLAVMNSASEDIIALFIRANPQCVSVKSSCGRTALDCAQYIIRQHWLYGTDDERAVKNTFAAIDILEKAKM